MKRLAFVGTRTERGRGTGAGLLMYEIMDSPGNQAEWVHIQTVTSVNPGYLALGNLRVDSEKRMLYVAHGDGNTLSSYPIVRSDYDRVRIVSDDVRVVKTQGNNPAHVAITPDGEYVLTVNHRSGSVASFSLRGDGHLNRLIDQLHFTGDPGPHRTDQQGSKPHQVVFLGESGVFFVPDKGLDTLFTCRILSDGTIEKIHTTKLREFSGPRHIAISPHENMAYCINELGNTVAVLDLRGFPQSAPKVVQYRTTLESTDLRDSRAGEVLVSPDGKYVYASNRSGAGDSTRGGPGNDSIVVWKVEESGFLGEPMWFEADGVRPRHMTFGLSDTHLCVSLESSGKIQLFSMREESGLPVTSKVVSHVKSPVCVVFSVFD